MAKIIRDSAFASRLERACEDHPHCPTDAYRGKQKWLRETLEEKFGEEYRNSSEAVRKWFSGNSPSSTSHESRRDCSKCR